MKTRSAIILGISLLLAALAPAQAAQQSTPPAAAKAAFDPNAICYVDAQASQGGNGRSWASAYRSVSDALAAGAVRIWVANGVYAGPLKLLPGTNMYGGFQGISRPGGGETSVDQREWGRYPSVIDAERKGSAVTVPEGGNTCVIDGFSIRNGLGLAGGGIACKGSAVIKNSVITDNNSTGAGGGICCDTPERVDIIRNYILRNGAAGNGGGISVKRGRKIISGNVIKNNVSRDGGGIDGEDLYSCIITSNTICDNTAEQKGSGGMSCRRSDLAIANNIVSFNSSGISLIACQDFGYSSNCVSQNKGGNYLNGTEEGDDDISPDNPFGSDAPDTHCHLGSSSPCRATGSSDTVGFPYADIDMESRRRFPDDGVDIGADAYRGDPVPPKPDSAASLPMDGQGVGFLRIEYSEDGLTKTEYNGNGTKSIYTYDERGRTRRIQHFTRDGKTMSDISYTLDGVGNPTVITTNGKTVTYEYDAMGRVTRAGDKTYKYDWLGNRQTPDASSNAKNQKVTSDVKYEYGPDGKLVKKVAPDGRVTTYTYDERGNLATIHEESAPGQKQGTAPRK